MKNRFFQYCSVSLKTGSDRLLVFGMVALALLGMIYAAISVRESSVFSVDATVLAGEREANQMKEYEVAPLRVAPFSMPVFAEPVFPNRDCVITDFGAVSGGEVSNTESFRKAIASCAGAGGGRVVVPKGEWRTGPIYLASNINLHIERGARVIFSDDPKEYLPAVFSRFEGIEILNYSPFVYAKDCKNIAITGKGDIDGNGTAWKKWTELQESSLEKVVKLGDQGVPLTERDFAVPEGFLQPSLIQFIRSSNILVEDVTLLNAPRWTLHPIYSSEIIVRGIKIYTDARNTDGLVIDSSRNVIVRESFFRTGDDAIVVKSGKDRDGLRVGKPSENIVIHNCTVEDGHSGVALGSEMSGGIRNVFAYDMNIVRADYGIRLKTMRGRGGVVENVFFENIRVKRAMYDAIHINMNYATPLRKDDTTFSPVFRNLFFKNVSVERSKVPFFLEGLPESPIRNLVFENVNIASLRKGRATDIEGEPQKDIRVRILE